MTKRAILLEALASTPTDVARLVRGLDETAALWPAEGDWSGYDVVAHLAHNEPLYLAGLQLILAKHEPVVAGLHSDVSSYDRAQPLAALVEHLRVSREITLEWLREIGPADWQRPAIHEIHGPRTLRFLVHDLVAHDIEHTGQLALILGQLRADRRRRAAAEALAYGRRDTDPVEAGP